MNTGLRRRFSRLRSLKGLIFKRKMVRYFQNPFEDLKPGIPITDNNETVLKQIDDYVSDICKRVQATHKNTEGGLYVGVTGISYMFLHIAKNQVLSPNRDLYLQRSLDYLKPALDSSIGEETSFLLGDAGTNAIATILKKEMGSETYNDNLNIYKSLYNSYLNPKFLKCGGDELFVGRAGYLAGALWMSRELKCPVLTKEQLFKLCDIMVRSGREYSKKRSSPCPLMYHYYASEYLGAAHGLSFILQMLLSSPDYLSYNKEAAEDIKASVEYMASLQTDEGNWPCSMAEVGLDDHKLVHWCHGAPGTIYLMAKAYLVYKDQMFIDACVKAADFIWQKGLLRKGPGICHGVAGNGYVFLMMFRLTSNGKYLHRAKMFADFLSDEEFVRDARLPDNPESLYEGTAGTVCFLSDLLVPDVAEFPFQDVFNNFTY